MDLTSVPRRAMPASNLSKRKELWLAARFSDASRAPEATGSRSLAFCGAVFSGLVCRVWLVCRDIGVSLILTFTFAGQAVFTAALPRFAIIPHQRASSRESEAPARKSVSARCRQQRGSSSYAVVRKLCACLPFHLEFHEPTHPTLDPPHPSSAHAAGIGTYCACQEQVSEGALQGRSDGRGEGRLPRCVCSVRSGLP